MKHVRLLVSTAALVVLSLGSGVHAANLVVNGGFETDSFNTGFGYRLGLINNDVTGWYIPAGNGTYPWGLQNGNSYGAGPAAEGRQWLVLGEWDTQAQYTIQQTLSGLTPGGAYKLSFAIASELGCCSMAEVSFLSGSATAAQSFTAPSSGLYWTQWSYNSMTFVANAASVTIQFKNQLPTNNGYDVGLDDVSVTAVPETSTVAMMGLGLAVLGLLRRRRPARA